MRTDWERVAAMSEREIMEAAKLDPDAQPTDLKPNWRSPNKFTITTNFSWNDGLRVATRLEDQTQKELALFCLRRQKLSKGQGS
jgi:hypothetical protein